jgi:methylated-DNA-[protein]-cysteine S-methyltransferase
VRRPAGSVRGAGIPPSVRYALLASPAGTALVAARGGKVVASFLPGRSSRDLVRRLRARFPGASAAPAPEVPGAADLRRWLDGGPADLSAVPVDLSGLPPFAARVYGALREVPPGGTVTYGDLARRAGSPGAARAVGGAMARNPLAPFVPCHRVLGAGGRLTGFSAPGGVAAKALLLAAEAAAAPGRTGGRASTSS